MSFATFLVLLIGVVIPTGQFLGTLRSCQGARRRDPAAEDLYTVKLRRQKVPVKAQEDSDAGATVYYKSTYFGTISVGYPVAQEFNVVFDSGSGHVIVPSTHCASEACMVHRRFDRNASGSAVDIDYDGSVVASDQPRDQITVAFGTGEVNGLFVYDTVCLGPSPTAAGHAGDEEVVDPRRCSKVRIVGATDMTADPFQSFAFDGVLGLGLESLALTPEFNFFGRMARGWDASSPEKMHAFAVFLADEREGEDSEITFGGYERSRLMPNVELTWTPVAAPELGYWQIPIKSVRVGNQTLSFCEDGSCRAVVDTGTSLLAVPSALDQVLFDLLKVGDPSGADAVRAFHGPEDNELDCVGSTGPDLAFETGDFEIVLTASDYARQAPVVPDALNSTWQQHHHGEEGAPPSEADGGHYVACRPTLMPIDLEPPLGPKLFIFGEPVLRRYYSVYDWKEKRVGFGLAQHHIPAPVTGSLSMRAEGLLPKHGRSGALLTRAKKVAYV